MPETQTPTPEADDLTALALGKLNRVLGPERGTRVFAETLAAANMSALKTADDLYAFSERLSQRGGIEAAVGGLLSVSAVMRGAAHSSK